MAENKQYNRVKEITDQLEAGIADLFESEQYRNWLTTMSRFHNYSLNNTLLIAFQKPDATLVAGYTTWKNQGRQVQKGQKAIRILAPTPYKQKVEAEKLDPNTRQPMRDEKGNVITETKEITRQAFKVVNVFDVSQTEGRELPTLGVDELTGEVKDFDLFFEALQKSCPVPIAFEQIESGAKGYYHLTDQRIAIQEGMSQLQIVKTVIHEMAHQRLHAIPEKRDKVQKSGPEASGHPQTRNSKEVEAESVAYTVCRHFGLDTSDYSFAYIAGWSAGKETPELKASLQTIRTAASEMIEEIEGHMKELQKEHSTEVVKADTDLTKEEKAGRLAAELDQFAMDVDPYGYADSVDDREAAVADLKEQLMKADNSVLGIKDYLQEMIEEGGEEASQAQNLLTKLLDLVPELQSMEIQRALADTRPEATITFYAAECMEFPNMGELHEGLTLQEAFRVYEAIPAERMNAVKGIGFDLQDGSIYSGQYPLMQGGRVQNDSIELVQHYKESPLVQNAIFECQRLLDGREQTKGEDRSQRKSGQRSGQSEKSGKQSVLGKLHSKQEQIKGTESLGKSSKAKGKEMEQS